MNTASTYFQLFCLVILCGMVACRPASPVKEISLSPKGDNVLRIQADIKTADATRLFIEYWPADSAYKSVTDTSGAGVNHKLTLINLLPATRYLYRVHAIHAKQTRAGKTYEFTTNSLPMFLQEQFKAKTADKVSLSPEFSEGLMLLNKRFAPGMACMVDAKGRLRWYMSDKLGFKVCHFTARQTVLSILGSNDEPTSYGHEILEVNLKGDTLVHLKKGMGDLQQQVHHEVINDDNGNIATIFVDKRVVDLRAKGGTARDTVVGDGIVILDKKAKAVWRWSVFDVSDPAKDPDIIKTKKDWMHANSLFIDGDGNFLMSFYNNGQIWKINHNTGRVMWKLGRGGTLKASADLQFTQAHAVHKDAQHRLTFFDNGVEKKRSGIYKITIDETQGTAATAQHILLPQQVYNGRMGSAYTLSDSTTLVCCSKRHIILLTNNNGVLLWTMETAMPSYRAEFISTSSLRAFRQ